MDDIELQQDVERYASQLTERVTQALEPLERSPNAAVSDTALRQNLLSASAAVDIASGPFADVNLLDMLVFVRLSRQVIEEYWVPEVYGTGGEDLQVAYRKSEEELWSIADKVLDEPRKRDLMDLIDQWRTANPGQVRVEGVRLGDFSGAAGDAARARAAKAKGLLSSVRSATQAADQALLLAERARFLVVRMPFLVRLQFRLAAREIVSDTLSHLTSVAASVAKDVPGVPLVRGLFTRRRRSHGHKAIPNGKSASGDAAARER
jgi:hypothetical protein